LGVATYSSWSTSSSGSTGNYMHQYCFLDRRIPSIMLEINGMWRDPAPTDYPRPPPKSTYFLTQVTSGTYNGYPSSCYFYKKAWGVYIAVAQSLPPAGTPPPTYSITFTVIASDTHLPISGASVTFNSVIQTTNVNGITTFTGVSAGLLSYSIVKSGYVTENGSHQIDGDDSIGISLTPNPPPPTPTYDITITITDSATALPIENVTYTLGSFSEVTNVNGVATITIDEGTYTLNLSKVGYYPASESYAALADASIARTLVAEPPPLPVTNRQSFRAYVKSQTGIKT
jgi:hypothetical protein